MDDDGTDPGASGSDGEVRPGFWSDAEDGASDELFGHTAAAPAKAKVTLADLERAEAREAEAQRALEAILVAWRFAEEERDLRRRECDEIRKALGEGGTGVEDAEDEDEVESEEKELDIVPVPQAVLTKCQSPEVEEHQQQAKNREEEQQQAPRKQHQSWFELSRETSESEDGGASITYEHEEADWISPGSTGPCPEEAHGPSGESPRRPGRRQRGKRGGASQRHRGFAGEEGRLGHPGGEVASGSRSSATFGSSAAVGTGEAPASRPRD